MPAFVDSAFPELFEWLREHDVEPAGAPFIRYLALDRAGEPLEIEVGAPVDGTPEGDERVRPGALTAVGRAAVDEPVLIRPPGRPR